MHLITERCTCLCPASSGWPLWGILIAIQECDSLSLAILECVYVILHVRMFPINGQYFSINKGRESLSSIIITSSSQLGPPYYWYTENKHSGRSDLRHLNTMP